MCALAVERHNKAPDDSCAGFDEAGAVGFVDEVGKLVFGVGGGVSEAVFFDGSYGFDVVWFCIANYCCFSHVGSTG